MLKMLPKLIILFVFFLKFTSSTVPIDSPANAFPRFVKPVEYEDSITTRFRLPTNVIPRHYKLQIRPILDQSDENVFTAPGNVVITVECVESTRVVMMHAAELDIDLESVRVTSSANPATQIPITATHFNPNDTIQTFTIELGQDLAVGSRYDININYLAKVANPADRMNGVYWSSYLDANNQTHYLSTTQFSRTKAFRKTLPSWDEPSFKATFEISVGRQENFHSLSNMNLLSTEPIPSLPGWVYDNFAPTPVMAPTIIAFIVSDFTSENAANGLYNKPVKIFGPPPLMENDGGKFAADYSANTLAYFDEYFGIEYELPKMDSVGIPDFAAGAMENWGLNTYRTMYLIWHENINTVAEKFRVANILGHELAHQWWGNLVTHAWWNDWWLTEGFASYFEYRSVDHITPEFGAVLRLVTSDIQPALEFDASRDSVPIHGNDSFNFVENPSTINYSKGAALVNFMRSFLGEDIFKRCCNHYLNKRKYTAVHQDALFGDFEECLQMGTSPLPAEMSFGDVMETWTLKTGFPLVRVSRAGDGVVFFSQERFLNINNPINDQSLWNIPISYISPTTTSTAPKFWLPKNVLMTTKLIDTTNWLLLNPENGYYRVLYDNHFGNLLKTALETDINQIPIGSRSMIVDDYFSATWQNYVTMPAAMQMVKFVANETNYNVWVPFLKHLRKGFETFEDADKEVFNEFLNLTMETALNKVGFVQQANENPMDTLLRVLLLDYACTMNDGCYSAADPYLKEWESSGVNNIPVDLRAAYYCGGVDQGNFDFLLAEYRKTGDVSLRNALCCTKDDNTISRLFDLTLELSGAEANALFVRLTGNSVKARGLMLNFINTNWNTLIESDHLGPGGIVNVFSNFSGYSMQQNQETAMRALIEAHESDFTQQQLAALETAMASFQRNRDWYENYGKFILSSI